VAPLLDDYLSRAKLAQEIGRTERTLARWAAQGIGPPITWLGRTPYYHAASVRAWLLRVCPMTSYGITKSSEHEAD
jgi:hypothetical protein